MAKEKPKKILNKVTESEFLAAWEKISQKLGYKFKFGYHSHEDMKQQAAIFALEGLKNYDTSKPLENFLWTHVRNRLFNYKRDNYQRPDKPCLTCPFHDPNNLKSSSQCTEFCNKEECALFSAWTKRNDAKKNIMKPVGIDTITENAKEINYNQLFDDISNKEILDIIDLNISVKNRPTYLKLKGGIKVPKTEIKKLYNEIKQILKDHDIKS
jgi:hypothetical protein